MSEDTKQDIRVCFRIQPGDDTRIFRLRAADEVLRVLVDAHETAFTMKELASETGRSRSTVWRAVELLDEISVVAIRETSQRKYVSIDQRNLQKDDPILGIEQPQYRDPVRTFVERVEDRIEDTESVEEVLGMLVFGSVARGEADRKSDIDVFVLVDGDRTTARRVVSDIANTLGETRFDGDRYTFEPFTESIESARRAGQKLENLFREGVTIYGGDRFQQLRKEVVSDER